MALISTDRRAGPPFPRRLDRPSSIPGEQRAVTGRGRKDPRGVMAGISLRGGMRALGSLFGSWLTGPTPTGDRRKGFSLEIEPKGARLITLRNLHETMLSTLYEDKGSSRQRPTAKSKCLSAAACSILPSKKVRKCCAPLPSVPPLSRTTDPPQTVVMATRGDDPPAGVICRKAL